MEQLNRKEFLCLEGSPFNRGLIHGKTLKKEILELVNIWKTELEKYCNTDSDIFITNFLNQTNYIPAIEKYTPDLLEEVKGIAKGSGIDFNSIFAFQLLDEFLLNIEDIPGEHCSSIGLPKIDGKSAYLAQNWDVLGYLKGFQKILHIKHEGSDIESFVFTYSGFISAFGMNNKRVGICVNSIEQLNYSKEGLPVAFIIRGILEQANQGEAIKFLHDIKHASPQNYLIGGPDKIHNFECSANRITPFTINEDSGAVYHTNHALINDDYNAKYLDYLKKPDEEQTNNDNSRTRFDSLEKRLNIPPQDITIELIKSALCSHDSKEYPICMNYENNSSLFTLGSTVMVLSEQPEFHVALGPPDVTPYKIYKFYDNFLG